MCEHETWTCFDYLTQNSFKVKIRVFISHLMRCKKLGLEGLNFGGEFVSIKLQEHFLQEFKGVSRLLRITKISGINKPNQQCNTISYITKPF